MAEYAKQWFKNSEIPCSVLASLEPLEYLFIIQNKQSCMGTNQETRIYKPSALMHMCVKIRKMHSEVTQAALFCLV